MLRLACCIRRFVGPCSKVSVLSDLDLELVEGHVTALVGESGSGKTTIAMLLERFYDPTTGCLCHSPCSLSRLPPLGPQHARALACGATRAPTPHASAGTRTQLAAHTLTTNWHRAGRGFGAVSGGAALLFCLACPADFLHSLTSRRERIEAPHPCLAHICVDAWEFVSACSEARISGDVCQRGAVA